MWSLDFSCGDSKGASSNPSNLESEAQYWKDPTQPVPCRSRQAPETGSLSAPSFLDPILALNRRSQTVRERIRSDTQCSLGTQIHVLLFGQDLMGLEVQGSSFPHSKLARAGLPGNSPTRFGQPKQRAGKEIQLRGLGRISCQYLPSLKSWEGSS